MAESHFRLIWDGKCRIRNGLLIKYYYIIWMNAFIGGIHCNQLGNNQSENPNFVKKTCHKGVGFDNRGGMLLELHRRVAIQPVKVPDRLREQFSGKN